MKHTLKITLLLLFLFLASHVVGLFVASYYIQPKAELPLNIEPPVMDQKTSYLPIFLTIIFATFLALIIIKFEAYRIWKVWFFFSVTFCLLISFKAFMPELFALVLATILAIFKVFKPNFYVHNFTEIFIYGALAALFVPVLNILSVSILLILISIYDMIAVWKTKHMISMAKFQSNAKMFTGLLVPYKVNNETNTSSFISKEDQKIINDAKPSTKRSKIEFREAILGGGDIGFPLLFSGVVLKLYGLLPAYIISLGAALALLILFIFAEKKKFYPAMPFVTAGCFLGFLVVRLLF